MAVETLLPRVNLSVWAPLNSNVKETLPLTKGAPDVSDGAIWATQVAAPITQKQQFVCALTESKGEPVILISGWVGNLPGLDPDHDWAWVFKTDGSGRSNRKAIFNAYYTFPKGTKSTSIPDPTTIKNWAKTDVLEILKRAYAPQGESTKNDNWQREPVDYPLPDRQAGHDHPREWKRELQKFEQGQPLQTFVDGPNGPIYSDGPMVVSEKNWMAKNAGEPQDGERFAKDFTEKTRGAEEAASPFGMKVPTLIILGGVVVFVSIVLLHALHAFGASTHGETTFKD